MANTGTGFLLGYQDIRASALATSTRPAFYWARMVGGNDDKSLFYP